MAQMRAARREPGGRGPRISAAWLAAAAMALGTAGAAQGAPATGADETAASPRPASALAPPGLDEAARWLAGMKPDARPVSGPSDTDAAWDALEKKRLAPMREFARRHFAGEAGHCGTLFYPFSGPDILNALAFFPHCERYVLFGLEPVGELPDPERLDDEHKALVREDMRKAQEYILRRNFFVTQYMGEELNTPNLRGVLPILAATLARMGYALIDAQATRLDGGPAQEGKRPRGVALTFRARAGGPAQTLWYASFDASDAGLARHPGFLDAMGKTAPSVTVLKAASYLLFDPSFSRMREFVEDVSPLIVQDDSGVPYARLVERGYCVELYGNYVGTIPQFRYRYQKDLAEAYRQGGPREPLGFSWSYAWNRKEIALQVARRPGSSAAPGCGAQDGEPAAQRPAR
jgi:hypothetical protein